MINILNYPQSVIKDQWTRINWVETTCKLGFEGKLKTKHKDRHKETFYIFQIYLELTMANQKSIQIWQKKKDF